MCKASPRDSKNITMVMDSLSAVPPCGCARCKTQKIETQVSMLAPDQAALPGEQFWLTDVSDELKLCLQSFELSPQDFFSMWFGTICLERLIPQNLSCICSVSRLRGQVPCRIHNLQNSIAVWGRVSIPFHVNKKLSRNLALPTVHQHSKTSNEPC